MEKIPFSEKELEVKGERPGRMRNSPPVKIYNKPITDKENMWLMYKERTPMWVPGTGDAISISPKCIPDNISRGFVYGCEHIDNLTEAGGPDMFGIVWEFVPQAGGSMVRPGKPTLEDANDWKEVIKFPDVDSWDWAGTAERYAPMLNGDSWVSFTVLTGCTFERLISFMDFEGAVMALVDEDQQDAVHELLDATSDVVCKIVDKVAEYMPQVDAICVHDDWGSQAQPFFSQETAMEMIVPYMKKVVDHIHSKGMIADLHSCGHIESRVECFIKAGWDVWRPQPMNDTDKLFREYGDKIIIAVIPDAVTEDMPEEEQRAAARRYVEKYCIPGKPVIIGRTDGTTAFNEELYKCSRLAYLGE